MKKIIVGLLTFLLFGLPFSQVNAQTLQQYVSPSLKELGYTLSYQPKGVIVVDTESGDIVFSENENAKVDVASVTKLMSAYVVFRAISQGKITLDDTIVATTNDQAISQLTELSNSTIVSGERYTIKDLLLMHLVKSSNVASVMLAKVVSNNDVNAFVHQMNDTAKTLGLTNTLYTNPSGAVTRDFEGLLTISDYDRTQPSYSSAKDVAKLAIALIKDFPQVLQMTSQLVVNVGQNTNFPERLTNTNLTLPQSVLGFSGVDGLKTGSSDLDGYSFVATVKRNDVRFVVVVVGVGQYPDETASYERFYISNALAEQSFKQYTKQTLLLPGNYMVDTTEIQVTDTYTTLAAPNTQLNYQLVDDKLIIERVLPNLYDKTQDELPIINITKQKLAEEKRKRDAFLAKLAIGFVIVVVLLLSIVMLKWKRQTRVRRCF